MDFSDVSGGKIRTVERENIPAAIAVLFDGNVRRKFVAPRIDPVYADFVIAAVGNRKVRRTFDSASYDTSGG